MNPLFKNVKKVGVDFSPGRFSEGDVLLLKDERSEWICHRLIAKREVWRVKGDYSHSYFDFLPQKVFGTVKYVVRGEQKFYLKKNNMVKMITRLQYLSSTTKNMWFKKVIRRTHILLLRMDFLFLQKMKNP